MPGHRPTRRLNVLGRVFFDVEREDWFYLFVTGMVT